MVNLGAVEGFTKTPGAGNEMYFAGIVNKVADKMGLIDKVAIIVDEFLEIGNALSQVLGHGWDYNPN